MSDTPEYFDLYDAEGRSLGRAKPRDEVHRDGDWHRSAHVWIFTSDSRLLFQRRAPDKDTWPSRLDASIGGHYRAGEESAAGIVREAREELGIDVDPTALTPIGTRRVVSLEPGIVDREIQDVYLLRCDLPLTAYTPDPVEIDGLALLDAHDAARLHAGAVTSVEAETLPRAAAAPERCAVTANDLIPDRGAYLAAIAQGIDEALAGRQPEAQDL